MKGYQSLGKELYPGPFQAIPMLSCAFIVTPTLTTKVEPQKIRTNRISHTSIWIFFYSDVTLKGFMKQKIKIQIKHVGHGGLHKGQLLRSTFNPAQDNKNNSNVH